MTCIGLTAFDILP